MSDASDERHSEVVNLAASVGDGWDMRPLTIAGELRGFMKSMKDEGSEIDSGGGDGIADLWIKIGGQEFHVSVKTVGAAA